MSIPVLEPRKHDRDQRERALVEAAMQVFAEKGFDCATTREIAERAGCSEGLIHRYFTGKRGLLLAILHHKSAMVRELVQAGVPDQENLDDEVRGILLWSLDFAMEQRDFMRVLSTQAIVDPDIGKAIGNELNAERVRVIVEKLRRHQRAGRVREDVDLEVVGQLVSGFAYQSGFFLQIVFDMPAGEVKHIVRETAHIIVRGIAASPSEAT